MADTEILASEAATAFALPGVVESSADHAAEVQQKYNEERDKRLGFRPAGTDQYIDIVTSRSLPAKLQSIADDPWADHAALDAQEYPLKDGDHVKFFILGAGFGGLVFAIHLIKVGYKPEDMRIVDSAGGFGGTWYHNRYPGLMCDVESYLYLPFLEETGYVPKHKYSYGPEIREYIEMLVDMYSLRGSACFRTQIDSMKWDEENKNWVMEVREHRGDNKTVRTMTVTSDFGVIASGVLNNPHVPKLEGLDEYQGHMFHTRNWDYNYTGGSDTSPDLINLKDKTVGIIGTGATCIQALPHLAAHAKEVYVFQRTPSAVAPRNQHPTDPATFHHTVANHPNWQRTRQSNFNDFVSGASPLPPTDLVADGWCKPGTLCAYTGRPGIIPPAQIPHYLSRLHATDLRYQDAVRARVDALVRDPATAARLKAWYPTWCKRPCFHDEYLQCYNKPNVHLVDTSGAGVTRLTRAGVVANGAEHPLDCVVFATGFRSPLLGGYAARGNLPVVGRGAVPLEAALADGGWGSLHGVVSRGFPNLLFPGPAQGPAAANFCASLGIMAEHGAWIVSEAERRVRAADGDGGSGNGDGARKKFTVEPTPEFGNYWTRQILQRAAVFAAMSGCTPGYMNKEGEVDAVASMEEKMKGASVAPWGEGANSFLDIVEAWRAEGKLEGLDVRVYD